MYVLQLMWENIYPTALVFSIALYLFYYFCFSYFTCPMKGNYDTSKKTIGKTLPPYPNGWYIACKSKELEPGASKAVDLSGHNITLFRSPKGQVFALHSYCSHMGANLGVGGQVVNETCIQCPFHGWLYDGRTGQCVDYDKKPVMTKTLQYNSDLGSNECKQVKWKEGQQNAKQRKYHTRQLNTFIYVWIHADETVQPYFLMLNNQEWIHKYSNRGQTIHDIKCHIQDIPENGADMFHFKFIHKYLIGKYKMLEVSWVPNWKRGDDPELVQIFTHKKKNIHEFKQNIYNKIVKPIPDKKYYSFATVDNYLHLPLFGPTFLFNITIIQMGPGLVNVYLKTMFFQLLFLQYIQTQDKMHQRLYHEMFTSSWIPYWLSSIMLYAQGMQVYYDMLVWDAKKVSYKLFYKDSQADSFIKKWRQWVSQHYQGCDIQLQPSIHDW